MPAVTLLPKLSRTCTHQPELKYCPAQHHRCPCVAVVTLRPLPALVASPPPAPLHRLLPMPAVPLSSGTVFLLLCTHPCCTRAPKASLWMPFSPTCQKIRFIWCFFFLFMFDILMRFARSCPYLPICFFHPLSQQYQVAAVEK